MLNNFLVNRSNKLNNAIIRAMNGIFLTFNNTEIKRVHSTEMVKYIHNPDYIVVAVPAVEGEEEIINRNAGELESVFT